MGARCSPELIEKDQFWNFFQAPPPRPLSLPVLVWGHTTAGTHRLGLTLPGKGPWVQPPPIRKVLSVGRVEIRVACRPYTPPSPALKSVGKVRLCLR